MNKLLFTLLIIIGFCQCNNKSTNRLEENKKIEVTKTTGNNNDDYFYNEDEALKPYHVDTLNELIPTKLIENQYDGFIVGDNVRLRTSADVKSDMIAELPNGLLLNILGRTKKEFILFKDNSICNDEYGYPWVEVETIDGQTGWIFGKFVYKVENLEHETINKYQGKSFEFNDEEYHFGFALDFSHPFMDNIGLSDCDDLGMLFFHKTGEKQIRPIIIQKPNMDITFPLEQNKKGFWHFVNYSDHLYEVKELNNKIQFKYHACVQAGSIDGVIEVKFESDQFYAKHIEYDDHQGNGNTFSEISDVKNSLFPYFETSNEIKRLKISSSGYYQGIPIQINGGGIGQNKGKAIPVQLVDKFNLYYLEIDEVPSVTRMYGLGKADAIVRGHCRWSYKEYDLLLYSVTIGTENSEVTVNEIRLLIIDDDGNIQKNIFIGGNVTEEGESNVDRSITSKPDGIELKIENEENYLDNVPKHLKLKSVELISL